MLMSRWAVCATASLALSLAPSLRAQASVSGVVRDSVSGRTFAGATIELVPARTPWRAGFTARSDSTGRFQFAEVPPDAYILGFTHPDLDALGLSQVSRPFEVQANRARITTELAPPNRYAVASVLCGPSEGARGVLIGRVRDALDGRALAHTKVAARWTLLNIGAAGLSSDQAERAVQTDSDGRYLLCDVPTDLSMLVQASTPDDTTTRMASGQVSIRFPYDTPLLYRDLYVAPSQPDTNARGFVSNDRDSTTRLRGGSRLTGRVIAEGGTPVGNARVALRNTGIETTTDSSGAFRLSGLPLGTHDLEMIALGYVALRVPIDLTASGADSVVLRPTKQVATLNEVVVRARTFEQTGFERRRRSFSGTFMTGADIERKGAWRFTDALVNVPGIRVIGADRLTGAPILGGRFNCTPTYFLDRANVGPDDISSLPISSIGAIEVYANQPEAPVEFTRLATGSNNGGCATVIVWTKGQVP